jgi:hypothetical protein
MEIDAKNLWWELSDVAGDIRDKDYELALSKLGSIMNQLDDEEDEDE